MMSNWKFFIARRIYRSREGEKEVSKPAVRIAMAGIAIGLAVMIVSVAVVIGFKHQVRDKVIGMGSDIVVSSIEGAQLYQMNPVVANDSLLSVIQNIPQIGPHLIGARCAGSGGVHLHGVSVQLERLGTILRQRSADRSVEQSAVSGNQSRVIIKRHLISPYKKSPARGEA